MNNFTNYPEDSILMMYSPNIELFDNKQNIKNDDNIFQNTSRFMERAQKLAHGKTFADTAKVLSVPQNVGISDKSAIPSLQKSNSRRIINLNPANEDKKKNNVTISLGNKIHEVNKSYPRINSQLNLSNSSTNKIIPPLDIKQDIHPEFTEKIEPKVIHSEFTEKIEPKVIHDSPYPSVQNRKIDIELEASSSDDDANKEIENIVQLKMNKMQMNKIINDKNRKSINYKIHNTPRNDRDILDI
jgi:hypothetical protein